VEVATKTNRAVAGFFSRHPRIKCCLVLIAVVVCISFLGLALFRDIHGHVKVIGHAGNIQSVSELPREIRQFPFEGEIDYAVVEGMCEHWFVAGRTSKELLAKWDKRILDHDPWYKPPGIGINNYWTDVYDLPKAVFEYQYDSAIGLDGHHLFGKDGELWCLLYHPETETLRLYVQWSHR